MMKNLKKTWLVISKLTLLIWQILTGALESLKILHFNGLLLTKVYNVYAKKVQRSYLSWRWRLMQNLKKNWLVEWKLTWRTWQNFTRALSKATKLRLWWDPFVQSRKYVLLKFTVELCVMTMKNDAKFEEELTCQFKTDMRNLTNFDPSTRKSQKVSL